MIRDKQKVAARKAAQRANPMRPCEACGETKNVQRHHPDYQDRTRVTFLCQTHHTAEHRKTGTWGNTYVPKANCAVCGIEYQPASRSASTICKAPECLREWGRRCAARRWHATADVWTDFEDSATPSCPIRPSGPCAPSGIAHLENFHER